MINKPRISIIGLGKLGAPIGVAIASRGFEIMGLDVNQHAIDAYNTAQPHIDEPQFADLLKKLGTKLSATADYQSAVKNSDITFIVVPTPSRKNGLFANTYVLDTVRKVGRVLQKKNSLHLVVVVSTVVPMSMERVIKPALEKASGKKIGSDVGLCYNPTFVALGSVIKQFLQPDFILIGESDTANGDILTKLYAQVCTNKPHIARMNFVSAEITKLALNTYVTTKISYANMLTQLCEHIPGAQVDAVTDALGYDRRIGHRYLTGATAYGGPCFPRDNHALTATGRRFGARLILPKATDTTNRQQIKRLVQIVTGKIPKKSRVTVLGITYQSGSEIVEESAGLHTAQQLVQHGYRVTVYDTKGIAYAKTWLGNAVTWAQSLKSAVSSTDAIVLTTNDKKLAAIKPVDISDRPLVIDCWRVINSPQLKSVVEYYPLGVGAQK